MSTKPNVFKSIFTAILGLIVFEVVYLLAFLLVGGAIYLLVKIPVIGKLVNLLFYMRGDSPVLMLALLSPAIAYKATKGILDAINKDAPTLGLSCSIAGMSLLVIHILSLLFNLTNGESILFNITQGIAGLVLFKQNIKRA